MIYGIVPQADFGLMTSLFAVFISFFFILNMNLGPNEENLANKKLDLMSAYFCHKDFTFQD